MHLRYLIQGAPKKQAQVVLKKLGIKYQCCTPQSIGEQLWFWNCENVPKKLPNYINELSLDPMKCIGCGLSKEGAESIRDYKKNN